MLRMSLSELAADPTRATQLSTYIHLPCIFASRMRLNLVQDSPELRSILLAVSPVPTASPEGLC